MSAMAARLMRRGHAVLFGVVAIVALAGEPKGKAVLLFLVVLGILLALLISGILGDKSGRQ